MQKSAVLRSRFGGRERRRWGSPARVFCALGCLVVPGASGYADQRGGERSFRVTTAEVENLPIGTGRNFASLTSLTPGVVGTTTRLGGGGQNNIMMDGVSTMDTGNNGQLLQMNPEAIAEVKVLTAGYQAEYGRSSGLQITMRTARSTRSIPDLVTPGAAPFQYTDS